MNGVDRSELVTRPLVVAWHGGSVIVVEELHPTVVATLHHPCETV